MPTASKSGNRSAPDLDSEWVSVGEAARLLNESRHSVLTRAVKGEVVARNVAGRTIVARESVARLIESREPAA